MDSKPNLIQMAPDPQPASSTEGRQGGPADRVCGNCRHWYRRPSDPQNLGQVRGDCREAPPTATSLPVMNQHGQQVGVNVVASYPPLPPDFPACSRLAWASVPGQELTFGGILKNGPKPVATQGQCQDRRVELLPDGEGALVATEAFPAGALIVRDGNRFFAIFKE